METTTTVGRQRSLSRATLTAVLATTVMVGVIAAPQVLASGTDANWSAVQGASPAMGATGGGDGNGLAVQANGKAVVTGWFTGTTYFPKSASVDDSFALTSATGDDVFVAEWDPVTNYFTKVTAVTGSADANSRFAAMSGADEVVIVGELWTGTHYFPSGVASDDSISVEATSTRNTYIAGWTPSTALFAWVQLVPGSAGATGDPAAVAVTGAGRPILSGSYSDTLYFPKSAGPDDSIALTSSGPSAFVAAMRSADDTYFAWAQRIDASGGFVNGDTVAVTGTNAPAVTGAFNGSASFPRGPGDDSITIDSAGDTQSVYLARFKSMDDSYFTWVQRIGGQGGSAHVTSGSVAMSNTGTPIATGYFQGTIYLPKSAVADDSVALLASSSGDAFVAATRSADDSYFAWALQVKASPGKVVESVAIANGPNGPVISGWFSGTATFPKGDGTDIALVGDDSLSAFAAGIKSDGSGFTWAVKAGGSGHGNQAQSTTVALSGSGTPMITGLFQGTISATPGPSGGALVLTSQGTTTFGQRNPFVAAIGLSGSTPTPPAPAPVYPASAPTGVTAAAGDASAKVTWSAPASTGSFPVTSYQATATPGGHSCVVAAPALTCEVTGLTNGTTYTFKVRALNGAGWSAESEPSNAVTPKGVDPPPVDKAITITGSRSGTKIVVTGSSTGIDPGSILKPWLRFPGQSTFVEGLASIPVQEKGAFTWERRAGKKAYVYIQTVDGKVKSNTVTIAGK